MLSRAVLELSLLELLPDRGSTAFDRGHYLANWKSCPNCARRTEIVEAARTTEVEDEDEEEGDGAAAAAAGGGGGDSEETTTFLHRCAECSVVICEHYFSFRFDAARSCQVYAMSCLLCGKGGSESFIDLSGSGGGGGSSAVAAAAATDAPAAVSSSSPALLTLPRQVASDFEVVDALGGVLKEGLVDAATAMRAKMLEMAASAYDDGDEEEGEGGGGEGGFDSDSSGGEEEALADSILFG
tara:strand:+ start:49 stop:771 length:723 start_codon:yes stop_codon:yes gene_type:complete